jgi:hypothetical protein
MQAAKTRSAGPPTAAARRPNAPGSTLAAMATARR